MDCPAPECTGKTRLADGINAAILLLMVVVLWVPRLGAPIDLRWDAGVYYVLGTSLYEGKGYRLLNEPGEIQAVQYPPALPALVAVHQAALGTSEFLVVGRWLLVTYFLMSVALALSGYRLARLYLTPVLSLLAAALAVACYNSFCFSDMLYAEIPFALAATWLAIFHHHAERSGSRSFDTLAGIMAVVSFLLRTAGLALLAAWVGESLLRRRFRQSLGRGVVALLPIVLWQGYVASVTSSPSYTQVAYPYQRADYCYSNVPYAQNSRLVDPFRPELGHAGFGQILARILSGVTALPAAIGESISVPMPCWEWSIAALGRRSFTPFLPAWHMTLLILFLLFGLIVAGAVTMSIRGLWFVPLCFVLTTALIVLAPWPQQFPRYLSPMLPFMTVFLVVGGDFIRDRARRRGRHWNCALWSIGGLLIATLLVQDTFWVVWSFTRQSMTVVYRDAQGDKRAYRIPRYGPEYAGLDDSLEWIREHSTPGDVVATNQPHTAFVRIGLKAVLPPFVLDPVETRRLLDAVPIRFVVLDSIKPREISERYAGPAVRTDPARWRLAYAAPGHGGSVVYERVRQ